jgi:hypothetical protein
MAQYKHEFVETWTGPLAQGFDRPTDEATLQVYLQMLSDDRLMEALMPRLSAGEIEEFFRLVGTVLKRHLSDAEYHDLFLRQPPPGPRTM